MKTATFGEIMPCTQYKFNDVPKERISTDLLTACFLVVMLFEPDDDSNTFLRNVGQLLPDHAALYPRSSHST
jgi:hypothetical protein